MSAVFVPYREHEIRVIGNHGGGFTATVERNGELIASAAGSTFDAATQAAKSRLNQVLVRQPKTEIIYAPADFVPAVTGVAIPIGLPPFNPNQIDYWVELGNGPGVRLYVPATMTPP